MPASALQLANQGKAWNEGDHSQEKQQLWLAPDVQKEVKAEYFARLEKDAAAGDAKAQATLGLCYHGGYGVKKDFAKAAEWYQQAAQAGHAGAQNNLGALYDFGGGVPLDHVKAHEFYLVAARQNFADAQFNVGLNYALGRGVSQSWSEARAWYEKAAAQGQLAALTNLGNIYLRGRGVPSSLELGRKYLRRPAEAGLTNAQYGMAASYMAEQNFSAAAPWLRRSAEGGDPGAQLTLASLLCDNTLGKPEPAQAIEWARKGVARFDQDKSELAPQGHGELARELVDQGAPASSAEAFREASIAAAAGDSVGLNVLGICYQRGFGVERNLVTAVKWYRVAVEQNNPFSAGNLGALLSAGKGGVPQDFAESAKWDRMAAEGGVATSAYRLGLDYRDGTGVDIDLKEAVKWLRVAAQGFPNDRKLQSLIAQLDGQQSHETSSAAYNRGIALAQAAERAGGPMDEAVKALTEAANLGSPLAVTTLARMYRVGRGVPQDDARAETLIAPLAQISDPAVVCQIGYSYLPPGNQPPTEKNADRALGFFQRAAQRGYAPAVAPLGLCCMVASVEHQDLVAAFQWLSLAAAQGDANSSMYLERLRPRLNNTQTAEALRRLNEIRSTMAVRPPGFPAAGVPAGGGAFPRGL